MSAAKIKQPLFLMLLVLSLFTILLACPIPSLAKGEVTVKSKVLNVRSGPGLEYDVVGQIRENEKYTTIEEQNNWYKIKLSNNQEGWIASWLVDYKATTGVVQMVESKVDKLNVRSGPDTSFQAVSQIHPEQKFPVVKEEGDWVQIQLNDATTGWVAKWLVSFSTGDITQANQVNKKVTVQASILNVRSGPNTSYSIVGKLAKGDQIDILEVKDGWYKIPFATGEGWIAGEHVAEEAKEASATPTPSNQQNNNSNSGSSPAAQPGKREVQVSTSILNVRASASLEAAILDKLSQNQVVEVINENGDWLEISYSGKTGWVARWLVSDLSTPVTNQPKVTILNNGTNLRKGPGTNFEVVARANQGESFQVVATEGDWFEVVLQDGSKAYVAGWIVTTEGIPNIERQSIGSYLKGKKVVIDPGHGGKDNGATGSHFSTLEKVVNLSVSNILKTKFEAAGAKVVMTRTTDRYLTLQQRVDVSIAEKADVFLSVHHNTNDNSKVNGTITYFYSNGQDRALANIVQQELIKANGLNDLKARKGNFFVLRENPRLAILIELGFLTNYNDELTIRTSKFQENSANGILYGVAKYFKEKEENS